MYQPHTLVTFGGSLTDVSGTDEQWQCGIRGFNTGGGPVPAGALDDLALAILRGPTGAGGGLEGIFPEAGGRMSVSSWLDWCKVANIAPDGSYSAEPGYADGIHVAGTSGQQAPTFCSVAISWTTGRTLGQARTGRIYPPNCGANLGFGSVITPTAQNAIADWAQELLHAVDHSSSDDGYDFNPYVVSKSGVSNPITGIRVGNVYDFQSRRKNAVPETYVTRALTGPSGD
jgi:hypothetical protein